MRNSMDKCQLEAEIADAFVLGDYYLSLDENELLSHVFKLHALRPDYHFQAFGDILAASCRVKRNSAIDILQENLLLAWRLEARHEQFFHSGDKSSAKLYISLVRSLNGRQLDLLINWQRIWVEEAVRDVMDYEPAMQRITVLYWLEGVREEGQNKNAKRK